MLGLLAPESLEAQVGTPVMAAIPSTDVVLFWKAGDPKVDHVMAVGVREIHDASTQAVSPVVFLWDGSEWRAFAEATPTEPQTESGPSIEEDPPKSGADGTRTHDL